jgi:hypothetical protein
MKEKEAETTLRGEGIYKRKKKVSMNDEGSRWSQEDAKEGREEEIKIRTPVLRNYKIYAFTPN